MDWDLGEPTPTRRCDDQGPDEHPSGREPARSGCGGNKHVASKKSEEGSRSTEVVISTGNGAALNTGVEFEVTKRPEGGVVSDSRGYADNGSERKDDDTISGDGVGG
jgi:hypothetical protein